ncbi:XRE family transcriptional regulator [Streptomyces eurocidicus]|uniref:Transcriptional regulator with XRE-family HTH domain n=1 Tax=Streptomyces eurocidicus TaxID=66423 RepID=A0A2N8NQ88_STREU|nr:helix-turn-helix transcriptional regulator [Streptomyces eurocidicus]MBB5121936.1 transcriptional regulator with XRE-family HTH domain [Streptomyces eurocidicus]MBF6051552.1 helix-turn-helix domain-containing protein [Streptomyces eurocidicus]PNE30935.1 XRE family transcriptional regulator [Streptomyces eurocidicus]
MRYGPAVRRRKLGAELRRQRELAGLTSLEAARAVGWHQSKVSRIETGSSGVKSTDVALLLDAYGVTDTELRALLGALCGAGSADAEGARRGWWYAYRNLLPPAYLDFISLESEASRLRTLETTVVPGLLQTPAYARAVTRAALHDPPAEQVEELVRVRMARQSVLRGRQPLELCAVLDEAVLRHEVGGRKVMAGQLRHLVETGAQRHVRLHVLPFTSGGHLGITGPFVIFSFPRIADLDVVVLDHLTSSLYLERKEDLRAYVTAFTTLQAHALSHENSLEFIAGINDGA